jgi:hypothetical protein
MRDTRQILFGECGQATSQDETIHCQTPVIASLAPKCLVHLASAIGLLTQTESSQLNQVNFANLSSMIQLETQLPRHLKGLASAYNQMIARMREEQNAEPEHQDKLVSPPMLEEADQAETVNTTNYLTGSLVNIKQEITEFDKIKPCFYKEKEKQALESHSKDKESSLPTTSNSDKDSIKSDADSTSDSSTSSSSSSSNSNTDTDSSSSSSDDDDSATDNSDDDSESSDTQNDKHPKIQLAANSDNASSSSEKIKVDSLTDQVNFNTKSDATESNIESNFKSV